jgi:hypothetical protein
MLQGILWAFDDPISDLLLAGIFVLAALQHRQMRLLQQRTNQLAFQLSELNALIRTTPAASHRAEIPHGYELLTNKIIKRWVNEGPAGT